MPRPQKNPSCHLTTYDYSIFCMWLSKPSNFSACFGQAGKTTVRRPPALKGNGYALMAAEAVSLLDKLCTFQNVQQLLHNRLASIFHNNHKGIDIVKLHTSMASKEGEEGGGPILIGSSVVEE
ncbi:hypothetical protein BY996DRAFT_6477632 [Phakopsora pachyrhizi]|nr:hypothetical protein BY996DRAFT_6477632 [Phakopsora pachyrhizi]